MPESSEILLCAVDIRPESKSSLTEGLAQFKDKIVYVDPGEPLTLEPLVAIFELTQGNYTNVDEQLAEFRAQFESTTIILLVDKVEPQFLSALLSKYDIFAALSGPKGIVKSVEKGIDNFAEQKEYNDTLLRVKKQNKSLESLKTNLQDLVHERTKSEYEENKQMEGTVKELQSLLRFIKNVGRLETIEELMEQIRDEFKKIRGIMPPLLIMADNTRSVRVFSFQGKQLIEKRVNYSKEFSDLKSMTSEKMKATLSNILGRPFGKLSSLDFKFKAEELNNFEALLVFEESLGEKQKGSFSVYSKERWPIINMALESLLLKESLHNIARQWARTFNEMEDPIIILDQNYKMSLSNADFHKQTNTHCYEAFANRDTPCKDCPIQETFSSEQPKTADIRVGTKIYRVHSYPIRMQGFDGASHVINQYVDVTQSIDLQSRVIQGEKMAAVGLLAGNIAHELNNPLTGIFSLSDLLLQDFEPESNLHKDLTEVKNAAKRCQVIIKDLLDFTEVGEDSRAKKIDVNDLLRKTLPLLKMAMRTLNSNIDLFEEPLYVKLNPQLLQQVLFNLINNACQAMEDNGYLYVTTAPVKNTVEIRVRDTGPGIPNDVAESVFEPFFTTKEEGKGTGLGLSMSKSVVERAGGTLQLNNEIEEGAEFIVQLPMAET